MTNCTFTKSVVERDALASVEIFGGAAAVGADVGSQSLFDPQAARNAWVPAKAVIRT
jgi:hypothetical protein